MFPVYSHSHHAPYHHQLRKFSPRPLLRYSLPQLPVSFLPLQNNNGAFLFTVKVLRSQSRRTYLIPAFSHAPSPTTLSIVFSKPHTYPLTHPSPIRRKRNRTYLFSPPLPLSPPQKKSPNHSQKKNKKTGNQHMLNSLKEFHQIKKRLVSPTHTSDNQRIPLSEG